MVYRPQVSIWRAAIGQQGHNKQFFNWNAKQRHPLEIPRWLPEELRRTAIEGNAAGAVVARSAAADTAAKLTRQRGPCKTRLLIAGIDQAYTGAACRAQLESDWVTSSNKAAGERLTARAIALTA